MSTRPAVSIHWFRRDLRLEDNHGLYRALTDHGDVLPLFIFDTSILERLEDPHDRRVDLIHQRLQELEHTLQAHGIPLLVEHGEPLAVWERLLERYTVTAVTINHDHEPYALQRDARVEALLRSRGVPFLSFKDISIFERSEVLKDDGGPYTVFTPYMRKWRSQFTPAHAAAHPSEQLMHRYWRGTVPPMPGLDQLGFKPTGTSLPIRQVDDRLILDYANTRDLPGVEGTSRMSVNLRFGMVSVRALVRQCLRLGHAVAEKYLNELIWREFYMQILWHFPHPERAFKPAYDRIAWRHDTEHFAAWCAGETGYPLVDAGMRELNSTGLMHNRVRMVTASFLTKHLLLDWRWGEAYFAQKLLDFELSSNNGGWQWAAGSGCDAAPYFRVFNPQLQLERYDPQLIYVKRWVVEWKTANYVHPMVVHGIARDRALKTYKEGLTAPEPPVHT
jgi:deoxyribodipyrimidine photo-lyase